MIVDNKWLSINWCLSHLFASPMGHQSPQMLGWKPNAMSGTGRRSAVGGRWILTHYCFLSLVAQGASPQLCLATLFGYMSFKVTTCTPNLSAKGGKYHIAKVCGLATPLLWLDGQLLWFWGRSDVCKASRYVIPLPLSSVSLPLSSHSLHISMTIWNGWHVQQCELQAGLCSSSPLKLILWLLATFSWPET